MAQGDVFCQIIGLGQRIQRLLRRVEREICVVDDLVRDRNRPQLVRRSLQTFVDLVGDRRRTGGRPEVELITKFVEPLRDSDAFAERDESGVHLLEDSCGVGGEKA